MIFLGGFHEWVYYVEERGVWGLVYIKNNTRVGVWGGGVEVLFFFYGNLFMFP